MNVKKTFLRFLFWSLFYIFKRFFLFSKRFLYKIFGHVFLTFFIVFLFSNVFLFKKRWQNSEQQAD